MKSFTNCLILLEVSLGQSDQLLGTGGMESNRAVKISLGGSHLDGNSETLEHLIATLSDNVDTDNLLLGACADKLEGRGSLVRLHGIVHAREFGHIHVQVLGTVLLLGLLLSQTNRSGSRVRENDRGDVSVIQLRVLELLGSEKAIRQTTTSSNSDYYEDKNE